MGRRCARVTRRNTRNTSPACVWEARGRGEGRSGIDVSFFQSARVTRRAPGFARARTFVASAGALVEAISTVRPAGRPRAAR